MNTYRASVDALRVISAKMTNPSMKIPEPSEEYNVEYTEQDSFDCEDIGSKNKSSDCEDRESKII